MQNLQSPEFIPHRVILKIITTFPTYIHTYIHEFEDANRYASRLEDGHMKTFHLRRRKANQRLSSPCIPRRSVDMPGAYLSTNAICQAGGFWTPQIDDEAGKGKRSAALGISYYILVSSLTRFTTEFCRADGFCRLNALPFLVGNGHDCRIRCLLCALRYRT